MRTAAAPEHKKGPLRRRHVPQRTCVGCPQTQAKRAKRELIRIVRSPGGTVEVDPTGKRPGRGTYLCSQPSCWEEALKRKRLEHALKTSLSPEERAALRAFAQGLAGEQASVGEPEEA